MVKFERSQVQAILSIGEEVSVTITGQVLYNDSYLDFRGYDMIKVISKGDKENNKK